MVKTISWLRTTDPRSKPSNKRSSEKVAVKQTYISYDLETVYIHVNIHSNQSKDAWMQEEVLAENSEPLQRHKIIDIKAITDKKTKDQIMQLIYEELQVPNPPWLVPFEPKYSRKFYLLEKWLNLQDDNDIEQFFVERNTNQKLTSKQIKFIAIKIETSGLTITQLSREYKLSKPLLYQIKAMSKRDFKRRLEQPINQVYWAEKQCIIECIRDFISRRSTPYNVKDLRNYVFHNMGKYYGYRIIYSVMKNCLNLSYKRCKPRPTSIDLEIIKSKRMLFWVKLSKTLANKTLIANIDESTINRNSKNLYSWSKKGAPSEFRTMPFVGSVNLVLTIFSNGSWFWLISNKTMNSIRFSEYIKKLNEWILSISKFENKEIILMLDNWSVHRSKENQKLYEHLGHQVVFYPPYSPQLAPVEMWFNFIKQKLKAKMKHQVLNLSNRFSHDIVLQSIRDLDKAIVRNWFKEFYIEVKRYLSF